MAIVSTEIESIHGSRQQLIFYVCTDHLGQQHRYGLVIGNDQAFEAEAHKSVVAEKVGRSLAEAEFEQVVG